MRPPTTAAGLAIAGGILAVLALVLYAYGEAEARRAEADCEARGDPLLCGFMAGFGWRVYSFYAAGSAATLVLAAGLVWAVARRKARRAGPQPS